MFPHQGKKGSMTNGKGGSNITEFECFSRNATLEDTDDSLNISYSIKEIEALKQKPLLVPENCEIPTGGDNCHNSIDCRRTNVKESKNKMQKLTPSLMKAWNQEQEAGGSPDSKTLNSSMEVSLSFPVFSTSETDSKHLSSPASRQSSPVQEETTENKTLSETAEIMSLSEKAKRKYLAEPQRKLQYIEEFHCNDERRDGFVHSGTRFRSILDCAFRNAADKMYSSGVDESTVSDADDVLINSLPQTEGVLGNDNSLSQYNFELFKKRRLISTAEKRNGEKAKKKWKDKKVDHKLSKDLAREKTAEVLELQQKLKEMEEHATALSRANKTLGDASTASAAKLERTTEALRISGINAANARDDADKAEEMERKSALKFSAIKSAMLETKRTCELVRNEHDEMASAAQNLESQLLQAASEKERLEKFIRQITEEKKEVCTKLDDIENGKRTLQETYEAKNMELCKQKTILAEKDVMRKALDERLHRLENELSSTRSTLIEAASATAETESTNALLNQTVQELNTLNETLHEKLKENLESAGKERAHLQSALSQSESETQRLRLQLTMEEEEIQRVKLDLEAKEKEGSQLRNRTINLERNLSEANSFNISDIDLESTRHRLRSSTPRLDDGLLPNTTGKENVPYSGLPSNSKSQKKFNGVPFKSTNCCVCFKKCFGIMKPCQCGDTKCDLRAHAFCLGKNPSISVSHPGTPPPSLPNVLCTRRR